MNNKSNNNALKVLERFELLMRLSLFSLVYLFGGLLIIVVITYIFDLDYHTAWIITGIHSIIGITAVIITRVIYSRWQKKYSNSKVKN